MLFEMVQSPTKVEFTADAKGRLLRFSGARLARAEVNKNQDEITPAGISELAATIAGCAIDIEHRERDVCGIFTEGAAVEDPTLGWVLDVGGLIHADRFPEIATGIQSGTDGLSIEADGTSATCSICSKVFGSSDDYCDHLKNKFKSGARRRVQGLMALGGGVVKRPAGNGTDFSNAQIKFVASQAEPTDPPIVEKTPIPLEAHMKNCPHCGTALTAAVDACPECKHDLTAVTVASDLALALASLKALGTEKEAAAATITELTAEKATLTAALEAVKTEADQTKEGLAKATETLRRSAIGARMTDEVWEKRKVAFLAMDETQFAAALELAPAKPAPKTVAGIVLGGGEADDHSDDEKRTIVL